MKKVIIALFIAIGGQISTFAQSDTLTPPFYIRLENCRPESSYSRIIDNGDGTAKYKGALYPINIGPKNGKYILVNGKKIYLKKIAV